MTNYISNLADRLICLVNFQNKSSSSVVFETDDPVHVLADPSPPGLLSIKDVNIATIFWFISNPDF